TATTDEIVNNYAATVEAPTETAADINLTPMLGMSTLQDTATPEGTGDRAAVTVSPTDKTVDASATPEGTAVAELAAPAATATPEITADAFETQPPTVAPRPGGLGPLRVFEIAVAVLAILLGLGAWFTRRSA
ncbi:MAG: hypothetical protein ABI847_19820, partial [Anaerolineales bacterium]